MGNLLYYNSLHYVKSSKTQWVDLHAMYMSCTYVKLLN